MKSIKMRTLLKEESYSRVSKKAVGNELYSAIKGLNEIYKSLSSGGDFEPKWLDEIIKKLEKVKASAKQFDSGSEPDDEDYK